MINYVYYKYLPIQPTLNCRQVRQCNSVRFADSTSQPGEALMTEQDMANVMSNMATRLKAEQMEKMNQQGAENTKAGEAFLAENAGKEGVKTTDSGLQYKVITAGEGKTLQKSDKVTVNYRGTLINGSEFDSYYSP